MNIINAKANTSTLKKIKTTFPFPMQNFISFMKIYTKRKQEVDNIAAKRFIVGIARPKLQNQGKDQFDANISDTEVHQTNKSLQN